jgi:hypothetical protein
LIFHGAGKKEQKLAYKKISNQANPETVSSQLCISPEILVGASARTAVTTTRQSIGCGVSWQAIRTKFTTDDKMPVLQKSQPIQILRLNAEELSFIETAL